MKEETQDQTEGTSQQISNLVLVLGDPSVGSYIRRGLESRGYECALAKSAQEAVGFVECGDFVLVVSTIPLEQDDPLLARLAGSRCTVICYQPAGGISCWLPVMRYGTKAAGGATLSASDFMNLVDRIMSEWARPTKKEGRKPFTKAAGF